MPDVAHRARLNAHARRNLSHKLKSQPTPGTRTAFREVEKKYLTRLPPPDYSDVIDLDRAQADSRVEKHTINAIKDAEDIFGRRLDDQAIYTLAEHPGAIFIPGLLSTNLQRTLIKVCLEDVSKPPNISNLDTHYDLPSAGLWYHYKRYKRGVAQDMEVQAKSGDADEGVQSARTLIENAPLDSNTSTDVLLASKSAPKSSGRMKAEAVSRLLYKLRWSNLGLLYHWSSKSYHFEHTIDGSKTVPLIPAALLQLSAAILKIVPSTLLSESQRHFRAEAGIVNYYQLKDTLMGHIDQSELAEDKALISISLGQSAIFLIGGTNRDIAPSAIYLRSGDALIMSGPARRVYHGVPRIIENSLPAHLTQYDDEWSPFADFLQTTRININLRQVFPEGYSLHS